MAIDDKRDSDRSNAWSIADRLMMAVLGVITAYALLQILLMGFGRDQGIYAMVAETVKSGGMPYRDAWDFKPPGVFIIYTLAQGVFGAHEWSIRVVEVLSFASLIPILGVLARRFLGDARIGWVAASLAIWVEAQLEFWHSAQPESFAGVLALAGLILSTHPATFEGPGARWKPWMRWVAAGLVFGMAGLMKPHLLGVSVVAAAHAAWRLGVLGEAWKRQLASFAAIGGGSVGTVVLCLLWFAARGALGDLHHTLFVFAPGYAATTWNSSLLIYYTYSAIKGSLFGMSAIMGIGVLLTIGLGPRAGREREGLWLIAAAAFPQVLGIAIQSKFFSYHYGATLPFVAVLAAPGLWRLWKLAQRYRGVGPAVFAVGIVIAADARTATRDLPETFFDRSWSRTKANLFANPEERSRVNGRLYTVADVNYAANLRVAEWLTQHTDPTDTVYIWGFEPHIYFAARRRSASKFLYNVPQRVEWENQWARDELMVELEASPPKAIVIERGDVFPIVTGNNDDSANALLAFPALKRFIDDRYEYRESIQDFELYLRR
ncbi:MAG: ArnT family glycosyltransferase [Coriobacteriia bacterium]